VVLFLGVLALTPFVPEWNPDPAWVAAWLTPITGSWFPLFPWVGFGLIGMLIAPAVKKPVWIWPSMAALSAACSQAVPPIGQAGFGIPFFFERLAWVLLSLGVCSALLSVPGFRNRKPMLIGGVMQIGRASLGYYIGHLVLGGFTMQLLVERLSPAALQATPAGCGIAVLLLTAATAIIVHAMHRITERNRPRKQAECTRVLSAHTENEVRSAIKVNAR
jgi:peptidoglycan/LPS O-acetylase OafA/YrhL